MKKSAKLGPLAERAGLDWSKAVRGKYTNMLAKGSNIVVFDPELVQHFPDSESVNRALHALLALNQQVQGITAKLTRRRKTAA